MDSLWVFLAHYGVEPTNNRAERALRFGVLWRKRSLGTASDKGNRWVERILSLAKRVLNTGQVYLHRTGRGHDELLHGQSPDLSWINEGMSTAAHPL